MKKRKNLRCGVIITTMQLDKEHPEEVLSYEGNISESSLFL